MVAFLTLVGTECVLVLEPIFSPDFEIIMLIHFCASKEKDFGEVNRPAIRWILQLWFTGNTRINIFARRLVVFFSSRVDLILIWIDNVLIMARIYILFDS